MLIFPLLINYFSKPSFLFSLSSLNAEQLANRQTSLHFGQTYSWCLLNPGHSQNGNGFARLASSSDSGNSDNRNPDGASASSGNGGDDGDDGKDDDKLEKVIAKIEQENSDPTEQSKVIDEIFEADLGLLFACH